VFRSIGAPLYAGIRGSDDRRRVMKQLILEDGMELFRIPADADVWFEDLAPKRSGLRVHINPEIDEIQPNWSRMPGKKK
jgi:hypothetical protein